MTFEYTRKIATQGIHSKKRTISKYNSILKGLCKKEMQEELHYRGVKVASIKNRDAIHKDLVNELKGIKRVPALIFDTPE